MVSWHELDCSRLAGRAGPERELGRSGEWLYSHDWSLGDWTREGDWVQQRLNGNYNGSQAAPVRKKRRRKWMRSATQLEDPANGSVYEDDQGRQGAAAGKQRAGCCACVVS